MARRPAALAEDPPEGKTRGRRGRPSLAGGGRTPRLEVPLPPALRARADERAEELGLTTATWVRLLIRQRVELGHTLWEALAKRRGALTPRELLLLAMYTREVQLALARRDASLDGSPFPIAGFLFGIP